MSKYCTKLTFCLGGSIMSEEEEKALRYFYLKSKKQMKSGKIKGLAYKSCFQFVKTIKDMASRLNQIYDLEEVLNYED